MMRQSVQSGRIEELKEFYSASELAASLKSLGFDEQAKGKTTDELRGQLVIEQLKKAAETLRVWPFVCPEDEIGAKSMPEIDGIEDYVEEEALKDRIHLEEIDRRIETFSERANDLFERYSSAKAMAKGLRQAKLERSGAQDTEVLPDGKSTATKSRRTKDARDEEHDLDHVKLK